MEESGTVYLLCLNVALAALVLVPLFAVLIVVACEMVGRIRNRKRVKWEEVPGVGVLPVLRAG